MKKIFIIFILLLSCNLFAQTTFFDSLILNGFDVDKKIEIYFSLIGKPVPFNYKLGDNGFYNYDRKNIYDKNSDLKLILEESRAIAESESVSFIVENGKIKVVRIFKLFENKKDFENWWLTYINAIIYTGDWVLIRDGLFKKGNKMIEFELLSEEEMTKLIPDYIKRYFSRFYFFETEGW